MAGLMVKRAEDELANWLATEVGFIAGLCRYDGEPIVLEPYQVAYLENRSRFRWVTKSRQVGLSFVAALEALARCHLRDGHTSVFVSFSQDEAKEKILVARQVYEELPLAYQKKLVVDSKTELAFESNTPGRRVSRILSVPAKAPRGKKGDVLLDELAHIANDREVYTGSTALILRSHGQLTGCSSPLGRRGSFWEIATEALRKYPHHTRQEIPWWLSRFFSLDVKRAATEAPLMSTEERVERFGRQEIIEQFDSLLLEDFQQEFENHVVDESYSFYPFELILPCTRDGLRLCDDFTDFSRPEGRIVAGFDVGRTHDRSELAVFEERGGRFECGLLRSYDKVQFSEQEADLRRLLESLPVARLSIDKSGIGMNLAENLSRDYPQVQGEIFSNASKERWATDFKILLQRKDVVLPRDREMVAQIHSIKRRVLPSGKVAFDAERTGRGHADRFWAIALACQKECGSAPSAETAIGVRVIG
ncbi:MAG: hypothetical protein CSA65_08985 [Proteobacteria bacterium]|nr:MAG: hypothetical protein CSB49_07495 [Pseudomonadota bacterium]PIE17426.1 MAG: hypothetical protein CSA65_08985 [Pseudomonadota bacterium]